MSRLIDIILSGTTGARPAAADALLYFNTTTKTLQLSNLTTWSDIDIDSGIFALLAGRAGGQTLKGGTASGDKLTLQSTNNATRGGIFLASGDWVDFTEITAPGTPASDHAALYAKDKAGVSNLYFKDDAGTEHDLTASGGGGINPLANMSYTDPVAINTWLNQNGAAIATVTSSGGNAQALTGVINSVQISGRELALPSVNYDVRLLCSFSGSTGNSRAGMYIRDHVGGKIIHFGWVQQTIGEVAHEDDPQFTNYARYGQGFMFDYYRGPTFFRITEDGANRFFQIGYDNLKWLTLFSHAVGTFMTPTRFGFFNEDNANLNAPALVVYSYSAA